MLFSLFREWGLCDMAATDLIVSLMVGGEVIDEWTITNCMWSATEVTSIGVATGLLEPF